MPERALFRLPSHSDLETAACLSNYQVAYHLLYTATRGAPGRSIMVDGAAGGLGSAAVQLAKLAGIMTIGLVSGEDKARALLAFGADHAVVAGELCFEVGLLLGGAEARGLPHDGGVVVAGRRSTDGGQ